MRSKGLAVWAFLTFILPFVAAHGSRRHQEVARRARGDVDIHKRQAYTDARFTFYDVGLGACGQYNVPSDWIVALNIDQYGGGYPGPQCFKSITIQYGGKTAQATIMDECTGCPWGGLDFSTGLFSYFADESVGVLYGTWWYNDGSGGGGGGGQASSTTPSTTWEPQTTTSTPAYTPPTSSTPAYTPPPTTSSTPAYTPPPTTTTTTSSTTSSTSATYESSTGFTSGLATPTGGTGSTPGASNSQNIHDVNMILVELGIALSLAEKTE